jgi:hypothetical protein
MDCPKCKTGEQCQYNFNLTIDDFKENGRFSTIKLPLSEEDRLPDEIIEYVFGSYHSDQCKPRHVYNIKQSLNELIKM